MRGAALILGLAFSGCARLSVREEAAPGEKPSLTLQAMKGDRHRGGCEFTVSRDNTVVGRAVSSDQGPTVLAGLEPGRYDVRLQHRKIGRQQTTVEVRDGQALIVTVQLRRSPATAVAMTLLRGVFYALYAVAKAIIEAVFRIDDGRCSRCDHRRCRCGSPAPKPPRKKTAVGW